MPLAEVLDALDYSQSPYYLKTGHKREPAVASLFRAAYDAGVDGIYVFQSSSENKTAFSVRPAVYVAEAQTPEDARIIHRNLWNLGQAPFLIVVLPNHIRVYTGFDYSQENDGVGIVEPQVGLDRNSILEQLADFCAEAINNGQLWRQRSRHLKLERRVDQRLLRNLSTMGEFLREPMKLSPEIAHALIGKYVYIRYLRDRNILSDQWFQQHDIEIESVLGRNATVNGLRHLCTILDNRFNGSIFPLDFDGNEAPNDEHVEYVASIFKGDELLPGGGRQLSLNFQVYDFAFIPIELLSSIYEQFLHAEGKGQKVGAYYTPQYLADYLISEMSSVRPLQEGMKVLDPACGSGVFLVLIYERLIEMRLAQSQTGASTLPLAELLKPLELIYGIERKQDACYVTEFSLILMLLHYADVSEFLHDEHFKLPSLHNTHIFQCNFFDDSSLVWTQSIVFDWIIGNPPWIKANDPEEPQPLAAAWIDAHRKQQPVDNKSVAEAFSWRILTLLASRGYVGLILPAAFLYNFGARKYRQSFFEQCEVRRMTNFSNLRGELFEGRATAPAVTIIYHQALAEQEKLPIEHYGPFAINQITKSSGKLWTITINEQEYQTVSPYEAAHGDTATWKFALWGTHRDKRAIARLRKFFPQTLGQLCKEQNGWHLHEGSQLRSGMVEHNEKLEYRPELAGKKRLDTTALNKSGYLFSIPDDALEDIPQEECFIRIQGGSKGLRVSEPPHIIMNAGWKYSIFSDTYFVIKPRQIALSAPQANVDHLRALSIFLSSSLIRYYLFFQVPQWGIERDVITLNTVKSIPIPAFTLEQIEQLTTLQKKLVSMELEQGAKYAQAYLDEQIIRILQVPESIMTLVTEFLQLRSKVQKAQQSPDQEALQAYAQQLANDLDGFLDSGKTHHRVTMERSPDLICCTVEFVKSEQALAPVVKETSSQNGQVFTRLQKELKAEFSQWVYVQRGLKMFGPSSVSLYKAPQLINWTRTQAMNDADDMIAEILSAPRQYK
ncbi:MAG TPA: N-6 DNA methylase [Ktedonobacteraceae bacterium]|nr:N-6 DNA methylase [Ktedonobacteraceae bacterium]